MLIVDSSKVLDKDTISFSELYLFDQCPYKHDLVYNQKKREDFTFYTEYGTALHEALEQKWKYKNDLAWIKMGKIVYLISMYFSDEKGKFAGKTPKQWVKSAFRIYNDFFPFIEKQFPGRELFDFELRLEEPIENFDRRFKGFIDLILHNKEDDTYEIIDLKTSGWGWGPDRLSETRKLYQVVLYKKFFCDKFNIDPKKVNTHYVLLLRSPSAKKELAIDIHSMSSGTKKVKNAVDWMINTVAKIKKGIKLKNPSGCSFCVCDYNNRKKRRR